MTLNKEEVLDLYRKKDCIEKIFLSYKHDHDINEKRSRTHSLVAMRGSLFINFVSLIIITFIDQVMKNYPQIFLRNQNITIYCQNLHIFVFLQMKKLQKIIKQCY